MKNKTPTINLNCPCANIHCPYWSKCDDCRKAMAAEGVKPVCEK